MMTPYFISCFERSCVATRNTVASHFAPWSFRTQVISNLLFGHFVPSNNHFVPRSFRTHFGHFVPRSTGYEMTVWSYPVTTISYPGHFVPISVISYLGRNDYMVVKSYPSHFVPILVISYPAKMNGWMD